MEENKSSKNEDIQLNDWNKLYSTSASNQGLANLQEYTTKFHYKEDLGIILLSTIFLNSHNLNVS